MIVSVKPGDIVVATIRIRRRDGKCVLNKGDPAKVVSVHRIGSDYVDCRLDVNGVSMDVLSEIGKDASLKLA